MAYPDFEKPFVLDTDASKDVLGAVFNRYQNGLFHVAAYGPSSLNRVQKSYHLHFGKLEFWHLSGRFLISS